MDVRDAGVAGCLEQLLQTIWECEKYQRFEEAKRRVEGNEEERRQIDEFRRRAYEVSSAPHFGEDCEDQRTLLEMRAQARKNPLVAEYLTSEMELCRLLQEICGRVMDVTDLQLDAFIDCIEV